MDKNQLINIAEQLVIDGKGILAADESTPTCTNRFESLGIEPSELLRNKYRDLLFTTEGINKYISGVILFDETIRQGTINGNVLFPEYLKSKDIIPGIKVDVGAKSLALHPGEKITEGLDGLRLRLKDYYNMGARFAKWRAVITIGKDIPSKACINTNAHALARYAALCQESSIVPIVEPEILMDGDHTIDDCYDVSRESYTSVFNALDTQNVLLEGIVLKPNMVVSGIGCNIQASVEEVADKTVDCLKNTVPGDVPGCAFLSGGQSSQLATEHLNKMNQNYKETLPWNLTFSYGRALQSSALKIWKGKEQNIDLAQEAFYTRAKYNSLATCGNYSKDMEVLEV